MADGAGLRLWDISPDNVRAVLEAHPRGAGFKRELAGPDAGRGRGVPGGRFALLVRCGVPLAVRLAPFAD